MELIAKTFQGLEEILAEEIKRLGGKEIRILKRAVRFEGDREFMYKANFMLRTAVRILVPLRSFKVRNEKQLYEKVREINWLELMGVNDTLAVDAVVNSPFFNHSKYAALKVKDAIVDQFRDRVNRRPNVNVTDPILRIHVHISEDSCNISIDSSGESLHKRGYRHRSVEAPLSEVLAAGMILTTGWDGKADFVDPMCGSGTLPIEAALIARQSSPHTLTRTFAFEKWRDFDRQLWNAVKEEKPNSLLDSKGRIYGFDRDFGAVRTAEINAEAAGVADSIHLERKSLERLKKPADSGILIFNPPYDERLTVNDIAAFYKKVSDILKNEFAGWEAWIISSNAEAMKSFALKPSKKIVLYNGALECRFYKFELFEGKRKEFMSPPDNSEE